MTYFVRFFIAIPLLFRTFTSNQKSCKIVHCRAKSCICREYSVSKNFNLNPYGISEFVF